jgi:hypothetical protein
VDPVDKLLCFYSEKGEADTPDMMRMLKSVARMILFGPPKKERIPRDPLPGLIPPKPAPRLPYLPKRSEPPSGPSIDELHKRFLASPTARKAAARRKKSTLDGK